MLLDVKLSFLALFTLTMFIVISPGLSRNQRHHHIRVSSHNKDMNHKKNSSRGKNVVLDLRMPGAHPRKAEEYLCTPSTRLSSRTSYIVQYEPHAEASTAHHILLIGCKHPAHLSKLWKCGGEVCRDGEEHVIYAWAKNAKALTMPKDVGFAIGGHTGINYIVMQVHYARGLKEKERDHSGIKIHMTYSRVKHKAEMYLLGAGESSIPPRSVGFHADIACRYERPFDMVPFAFRTHAHSTARVISAYRVRNGKWKLIGIGNPQLPQAFYPIPLEKRPIIRKGDILAGRCTYDTPHRNRWTYMGATSKDEMCNFYIMYYNIYKDGKDHSGVFSSECMDIAPGISKSELKFPADSDKLPESMKSSESHHHHHHSVMAGDAFGNHDDLGHVDDDDDNDDRESEPVDAREVDSTEGGDDIFDGVDIKDPDDKDLDDRLENEETPGEQSKSLEFNDFATGDEEEGQNQPQRGRTRGKGTESDRPKNGGGKVHDDSMESDLDNLEATKGKKHKDAKTKAASEIESPKVDGDWPYKREELMKIGQVSALGMNSKHLLVLHRADRTWDERTFDAHHRLTHKFRVKKISSPTVLHLDPKTGAVMKRWGANAFYLPHGLTVDKHGNIWITDIGAHQVFKFLRDDLSKPALTLGIPLRPGKDNEHFCKPADVAVQSNGNFFVADGYCNSRIMKFSSKGDLLKKWGRKNKGHGTPGPGEFSIPHSLALDEKNALLYVADRENGRIQCFDTDGKFIKIIYHKAFGGRLFAISFTPANDGLLYAVSGPSLKSKGPRPYGFTIDPKTKKIINKWSPFSRGFTRPHDVQALHNNSAVFVSEIGPNRVWKFNVPVQATPKTQDQQDNEEDHRSETKSETPGKEKDAPHEEANDEAVPKDTSSPYKYQKPEDESNIIPAIVVVVVLATPIALICAAATIQHLRFKHRKAKALRNRNEETLSSRSQGGCFSCCRTKKYYYDNKRGFDKLIGEDDSEESEEDYFVRKGAI